MLVSHQKLDYLWGCQVLRTETPLCQAILQIFKSLWSDQLLIVFFLVFTDRILLLQGCWYPYLVHRQVCLHLFPIFPCNLGQSKRYFKVFHYLKIFLNLLEQQSWAFFYPWSWDCQKYKAIHLKFLDLFHFRRHTKILCQIDLTWFADALLRG